MLSSCLKSWSKQENSLFRQSERTMGKRFLLSKGTKWTQINQAEVVDVIHANSKEKKIIKKMRVNDEMTIRKYTMLRMK